jgi:hypothetical protein
MVNSLTGRGSRNQIVDLHRWWVLSTSHRFVTDRSLSRRMPRWDTRIEPLRRSVLGSRDLIK